MENKIRGIHHVTAITADAQDNVDFYCGVLGLRLVKLTVNFDAPTSYHLYYGDGVGSPGTVLTFFVWAGAYRGQVGPPQVTSVAFAVPEGALEFWAERLRQHQVQVEEIGDRFGESVLGFDDPDGVRIELVAAGSPMAGSGPVEPGRAIQGFHSVTLSEEGYEKTAKHLTDVFGFQAEAQTGKRFRYRSGSGEHGSVLDVLCLPDAPLARLGGGVVHHVAFRTPDDAQQAVWRGTLCDLGYNVTPVIDRQYFHSIYFREPGGVLFEIATDGPGFAIDEPADELGKKLMLPPWLEPLRGKLERILPQVQVPDWPGAVLSV
ncbi:MAG: ring-cleaving dioxygenase [Candidatus Hydrogenedentes bacterium]|nr:ring-cleaving dioxygenase [Candidatus Hydrogenedentota bacterium]